MKAFGARYLFTKNYISSSLFQLTYSDEFNIFKLKEGVKRFYIARVPLSQKSITLTGFLKDEGFEKEGKFIVEEIFLVQ